MEKYIDFNSLQDVVEDKRILDHKIDFVVLMAVNNANPNGDPNSENRPRTDFEGYGMISDVCIKRKLRNRLADEGLTVFRDANDGIPLLDKLAKYKNVTSDDEFIAKACKEFADVKLFGEVFATGSGFKVKNPHARGPVSICLAKSLDPVEVESIAITSCNNREKKDGKDKNTMGQKHFVKFGLYEIKGSISCQLAEKNGLTYADAKLLRHCLRTLFMNDASAARPDGSMEVLKVYWWEHGSKYGQYSSAAVHRTVRIEKKEGVSYPKSVEDYVITRDEISDLRCEETEGL